MSTNCIKCVARKRTGSDLLCDECRASIQKIDRVLGNLKKHNSPAAQGTEVQRLREALTELIEIVDYAVENDRGSLDSFTTQPAKVALAAAESAAREGSPAKEER